MSAAARPTVLHYTGYEADGGGILAVIRNLATAGRFECVHGVGPAWPAASAQPPALVLPAIDGERISPLNYWRARAVAAAVQAWLRADPVRIFHGHSRAGLLVALWLQGWGETRFVVSVHCYGRQRWFYRWAAGRLGRRLFWLSPAMKQYYGAGDATWTQCIPGGVPPSTATRTTAEPGRLRLGGIGALVAWKGWLTVIEALAQLPAAVRGRVTFTHIGGGDAALRAALAQQVQAAGLEEQVNFNGAEPSSAALLGRIDALVVASVNEPFSVALLEALAAGVPVIAADSGGARDVIRDGVNGQLYPTGDAAALARVIESWLANPPAWPVEQIRATTVPVERVAAQWAEVYAAL